MRSFTITLLLLTIVAAGCKKGDGGTSCHTKFTFKNSGSSEVIIANEIGTTTYFCNLRGEHVAAGATYDFTSTIQCWEKELDSNRTMDLYVVDPAHFNVDTCYSRDSIYARNTVLKHFTVSITMLSGNGYQLVYP